MSRWDSFWSRIAGFQAIVAALPVAIALLQGGSALAQVAAPNACGDPFHNHFGPWDYRAAPPKDLKIVEDYHFTPGVESLTRPATTTYAAMAGDVGYTLHVFPNHHRALLAMTRLGERHKSDKPPGASFTIDCYFDRATRFAPDDTVVRLYAQYLGKHNRKDDAIRQLEFAIQKAGDNPISHYSIGTVFLELGEFDRALMQAHKAKAMGLQWRELEEALKKSGHWKEPEK
jgi:tetratricopeptide (TPR) repeat protein